MKKEYNNKLAYSLIAVPLIAGAVWGGYDLVQDYRKDNSAARQALEQGDIATAKALVSKTEECTRLGDLIVPLSRRNENKLKEMIENSE